MNELKIVQWNANGVSQHKLEIETFLNRHSIDIMLISETHLTSKNNFKMHGYTIYETKHPDDKSRGGTAILIKNRIRHYQLDSISEKNIQATSIAVIEWNRTLNISSIYCPPNKKITEEEFSQYFKSLGTRFLAAGDYNAKSPHWGSRITTPKGKTLLQTIYKNNLQALSGGIPTYWPTDRRKIPDIIDFSVLKNIALNQIKATTIDELSSDHSPTIYELSSTPLRETPPDRLTNKKTNWGKYHNLIDNQLCPNIKIESKNDIEKTIKYFNDLIAKCARASTPAQDQIKARVQEYTSTNTLDLLAKKRRAKREWQKHRSPNKKAELNNAVKMLKESLQAEKNSKIQEFIQDLSPNADTNYSLWKITKKTNRPILAESPLRANNGNWIREDSKKAEAFAEHLKQTFTPNKNQTILPPIIPPPSTCNQPKSVKFSLEAVIQKIKELNPNKAPGHDLITGKLLKELPLRAKCLIQKIFNAVLKLNHFPSTWKLAKIIMIPKPGKDRTQIKSYRPISLLPILSKLFEKLLLEKIQPHLNQHNIIPQHQFGFRHKHSTIEQVHRITNCIKKALDERKYCTGVFLDIAQAFDKVWHDGLISKIKQMLPNNFHKILESYLKNRKFKVAYKNHTTGDFPIAAGVPQGSVLGPVLYILFTADLPTDDHITTTTFADDTAILYTHVNRHTAARELQQHLHKVENWANKWGIKINEDKSNHITFTLKSRKCRHIVLNNLKIPQVDTVKYLGIHLDRKLTWRNHIVKKQEQMKIKFRKLYWLLNKKSKLTLDSKILLYNSIIKPIWLYGIQLWGSAKKSNLQIIERAQTKIIRAILGAPRYMKNKNMLKDVNIKTAESEAMQVSTNYANRLRNHPNVLAQKILISGKYQRIKRKDPLELANLQ